MPDFVYADHAATAPLSKAALKAMMPFLTEEYGNASSAYAAGRRARRAVDRAREKIAHAFGAHPDEIYFTSCGTESDNWVMRSPELCSEKKEKIISSSVEHHAILNTLEARKHAGLSSELLGADGNCRINVSRLKAALGSSTALVSIMAANNEVGTVMPIAELAEAAHKAGALFHTDAVQAAGHIPIDVEKAKVDLMSFSAHKFGGPKGIGGLYIRRGVPAGRWLYGGGQERGLRGGTENTAGIVGMAVALEESCENMEKDTRRISALRDELISGVQKIPGTHLTGDPENRLPGNASFIFEGAEGEALVLLLDQAGICVSAGSACSAGALEPSHVLLAMGIPPEMARGSLRITLGAENTEDDIRKILEVLPDAVARSREAAGK